jgi:DNA-directed RNA polymerase specialized sigma24 family protein
MTKSNRRNAAIALYAYDLSAAPAHVRPVLDAVIRAHRGLLVQTAEQLLEDLAQDADDIVQDAFDDLHAGVARKAIAHRRRHGGQG